MTHDAILECVPNFSEGLDEAKVLRIVSAMRVEGVSLLDFSRDADHNRSVVTIAGQPAAVVEAAVRAAGAAAELIDLTRQSGVHPRIGAADVIPFVPVRGISLAECGVLARQAGTELWRRFGIPVYFYGAAAMRPDRVQLEDVRRGQFEGLRQAVSRETARRPDVGGPELHATAGASAVGSRPFLIAYNVYLGPAPGLAFNPAPVLAVRAASPLKAVAARSTDAAHRSPSAAEISAARAIAREIRASSGGMQGVKALGMVANGRAQVSMNITDFRLTPMPDVHAKIERLARRHSLIITEGELIGLVPEAAYDPAAAWVAEIPRFHPEQKVLERRLETPMPWPGSDARG